MIINAFRARPTGFSKIVAARYALTTEHKIARPINVRLAISSGVVHHRNPAT
jgi:hypothetical protein